jgi:hypothetical protein
MGGQMDALVTILLGAIGTFFIVMNAGIIYSQFKHKSSSSWIPVLGGTFLFLALCQLPYKLPWYILTLPFIIDWGCIPGMLHTFIYWKFIYPKKKDET